MPISCILTVLVRTVQFAGGFTNFLLTNFRTVLLYYINNTSGGREAFSLPVRQEDLQRFDGDATEKLMQKCYPEIKKRFRRLKSLAELCRI